MGIEKRKERRIRVSLPIKIVYQRGEVLMAETENISRLGAYVEIEKKIPLGADIDIALQIPPYTKDPSLCGEVKCQGNIFRSSLAREIAAKKYYGIGIFFTRFAQEAEREKLSKYIDFLILNEDKVVKEGIRQWRDKRKAAKDTRKLERASLNQKDYQKETLALLNQILTRLEEISRLLQPQNKTK